MLPSLELEEKQNGRRKADCSGGKVVRVKEQAFERAFVNSQLIAGTHKLNTGGQLYKRRHGDKQRKYDEELLNRSQRVVGALQYLVKQVEESRNRHKKQNIHVLRRRQRCNAHVDGRPDAHGGQGAEHGKNLARNMLAFQKKYDKTKQYKYQGQRVVDTRHADLKRQRGPQHIGCEHDV